MAADDEFPRGWVISSSFAAGASPNLIAPIAANVVHVLTAVTAEILNVSAAVTSNLQATIQDNHASIAIPIGWISPDITASNTLATFGWSGKIHGPVGASLGVTWNANVPAGCFMIVTIEGYDI